MVPTTRTDTAFTRALVCRQPRDTFTDTAYFFEGVTPFYTPCPKNLNRVAVAVQWTAHRESRICGVRRVVAAAGCGDEVSPGRRAFAHQRKNNAEVQAGSNEELALVPLATAHKLDLIIRRAGAGCTATCTATGGCPPSWELLHNAGGSPLGCNWLWITQPPAYWIERGSNEPNALWPPRCAETRHVGEF